MKEKLILLFGVLVLLMLSSEKADTKPVRPYTPEIGFQAVDIPQEFRCRNWGGGSCVHASTVSKLRYHGYHDLADWWRRSYIGGEWVACPDCGFTLIQKLDKAGVPYAYTNTGNPQILDDASRTRRAAVITYKPRHAINFLGYVNKGGITYARLLDNNRTGAYEYVEKNRFLRAWRGYGGNAVVLLLDPPPPQVKL